MIAVVGSGAGPNLVRMRFLTEEMRRQVEPNLEGNLRAANNTQLKVVGLITLIVQVGYSIVPFQFSRDRKSHHQSITGDCLHQVAYRGDSPLKHEAPIEQFHSCSNYITGRSELYSHSHRAEIPHRTIGTLYINGPHSTESKFRRSIKGSPRVNE